jgi:CMP-N,N'-diacetyllegionaminic acid synthase
VSATGAIAIIPARGGSKGIKDKNIALLGGKPLIAHTIDAARGARSITRIVVSTDSDAIARVAESAGAEVLRRPRGLATDRAPTAAAIRHALEALDAPLPDIVVVLQPTSPLRGSPDIDGAVRLLRSSGAPEVNSVCLVDHPIEWVFRRSAGGRLTPVVRRPRAPRRQDAAPAVRLNGAVYVVRRHTFLRTGLLTSGRTVGYVMPRERSIDIDEPADLVAAEALLAGR